MSNLNTCILPSLQICYDLLLISNMDIRKGEALVSALIEEVEDIADDVREPRALSESTATTSGDNMKETLLEAEMSDLLKSLNGACYVIHVIR
jgi:hypothetical protein